MDLPLTKAFIQKLPNAKKTEQVKEAVKKGVEIGVDHYALMSVAATAGMLSHDVMQQVINAWSQFLGANAATYKLSDFLMKHANELIKASNNTPSEVSFATSMATMRLIENRLADNSGIHTDETLSALSVSWKLEIIRLVGTDEEFEKMLEESATSWSDLEDINDD